MTRNSWFCGFRCFDGIVQKGNVMDRKNQNRSRIVGVRLTVSEFHKLEQQWRGSTCRKLSEYARSVLLGKPIIRSYRNKSLDESMTLLIQLRNELNAIGINLNQSVKKLHTFSPQSDLKSWILNHQLQARLLSNKLAEIKLLIQKMGETWLQ